jgi:hypothetical protein
MKEEKEIKLANKRCYTEEETKNGFKNCLSPNREENRKFIEVLANHESLDGHF